MYPDKPLSRKEIEDLARSGASKMFFEPSQMAFFKSRLVTSGYPGGYFVTHETDPVHPRFKGYTIRRISLDGSIATVGLVMEHKELTDALSVIAALTDMTFTPLTDDTHAAP